MKRILYLGTDPSHFKSDGQIIHCPLIQIVPRPIEQVASAYEQFASSSHVLFTSKNAVNLCFAQLEQLGICPSVSQEWMAIGQVTASQLKKRGVFPIHVADDERQEGVIALLETITPRHLFIPKSSLSRAVLFEWLKAQEISHTAVDIYDTVFSPPVVTAWEEMDVIVFTSPSTVKAFIHYFGKLPRLEQCFAIGEVTQRLLSQA